MSHWVNTLRPTKDGCQFPDDIYKCLFLNENIWIWIEILLKFTPKDPINNIPALVQIMAWRRPGDKPLSGSMMVSLLMHICVTRPQWVNGVALQIGMFRRLVWMSVIMIWLVEDIFIWKKIAERVWFIILDFLKSIFLMIYKFNSLRPEDICRSVNMFWCQAITQTNADLSVELWGPDISEIWTRIWKFFQGNAVENVCEMSTILFWSHFVNSLVPGRFDFNFR